MYKVTFIQPKQQNCSGSVASGPFQYLSSVAMEANYQIHFHKVSLVRLSACPQLYPPFPSDQLSPWFSSAARTGTFERSLGMSGALQLSSAAVTDAPRTAGDKQLLLFFSTVLFQKNNLKNKFRNTPVYNLHHIFPKTKCTVQCASIDDNPKAHHWCISWQYKMLQLLCLAE